MSTTDEQQQDLSPSHPMQYPTTDRTSEKATKEASSDLAKNNNGDTNALPQSSALAIAVGGCSGECNYDPENGEDLTEIPLSPTTKPQKAAIAIVWLTDHECPPVAIAVPLGSSSLVDKTTQTPELFLSSSSSSTTFLRWILGTLCYLTILLFLASIGMLLVRFIAHDHRMHRDEDDW